MSENICTLDLITPQESLERNWARNYREGEAPNPPREISRPQPLGPLPRHISPYLLFSNPGLDLDYIKDNNEDFLNDFSWLDDEGQVPELLKKRIDLLYSDNPTGCEPNNELVNALYIRWHIKKIQDKSGNKLHLILEKCGKYTEQMYKDSPFYKEKQIGINCIIAGLVFLVIGFLFCAYGFFWEDGGGYVFAIIAIFIWAPLIFAGGPRVFPISFLDLGEQKFRFIYDPDQYQHFEAKPTRCTGGRASRRCDIKWELKPHKRVNLHHISFKDHCEIYFDVGVLPGRTNSMAST